MYQWCLSVVLMVFFSVSYANSLVIAPKELDLSSQDFSQPIYLENTGKQPIMLQARLQRWQKSNGKEQLVDTKDVVIKPRLAKIEPGRIQIFSIDKKQKNQDKEQAYRLVFEEIINIPATADKVASAKYVDIAQVPVYMQPLESAPANMIARLERSQQGQVNVKLNNQGNRRLNVTAIQLVKGGTVLHEQAMETVIFPDEQQAIQLDTINKSLPLDQARVVTVTKEGKFG